MRDYVLPVEIRDSKELSRSAKDVLRVIYSYAEGKGECFPSMLTIVREAGYSKSTVIRALNQIRKLNKFVVITQVKPDNRRFAHNHYTILNFKREVVNIREYREDPNKKYTGCVQKGHKYL